MSQAPQCGLHSFIYSCTTVRCEGAGRRPVWSCIYLSAQRGKHSPSLVWWDLISSTHISAISMCASFSVQTLNIRCGLLVPAQKSHSRCELSGRERSFFLKFGPRLPQQPFAKSPAHQGILNWVIDVWAVRRVLPLMLLAVTSKQRWPLRVGVPTVAGQSGAC